MRGRGVGQEESKNQVLVLYILSFLRRLEVVGGGGEGE